MSVDALKVITPDNPFSYENQLLDIFTLVTPLLNFLAFIHGALCSKNPCRIYHVINYLWIHDTLYNNESFKDTVVKSSEVYRCEDATVGKRIEYYLDGKISIESNYVLMNDSTKNVISMENFNKINYRDAGLAKYDSQPDGTWKYYSKEGKLIKEEVYDKGTLQKTINY